MIVSLVAGTFHYQHHQTTEAVLVVVAGNPARLSLTRWLIELVRPKSRFLKLDKNALVVIPLTQSSATSITTLFLSLATSARHAGGTGLEVGPSGMFR